ncbi:ABC transporter permease [Aquirhabdus parva]|uniref:ABC transporter permease n=2 Tax=Aquirhabdus parva TaxID=2283318 RepID=A0A345PB42_9GAMM|nr:ABC transporter permease [Aquirhabdus parva]
MREILTRYGRHNIGFLWLFVEPMLFTLGVTALWTLSKVSHGSNQLPIVAFAITGYSSVLLWRNMPSRTAAAVEPNLSLMYHRNVKVIDIYISRLFLEFAGATASFLILSIVFFSIGWLKLPEDILEVIVGWLMLTWFGVSLALVVGALSSRTEIVDKLWHPMSYLLFPLSGAAFMVDWLPPAAQKFVLLLPMVHGVEMVREGYFGSAVTAHYNLPYMAFICLCLTAFGLTQERIVSRKVTPE